MTSRAKRVREPIQVYLDGAERSVLDRLARDLAVSRAEVLRRGLDVLQRQRQVSVYDALQPLIGAFGTPDTPTDLAERHDEYLGPDVPRKARRSPRRRSS
jgi:hypothetical protein